VMALTHSNIALANESLWRMAARIGDFREFDYEKWKAESRVSNSKRGIGVIDNALKVCCVLNTLEKTEFQRAYENGSDAVLKWPYFINHSGLLKLLQGDDKDTFEIWREEYELVLKHCRTLHCRESAKIMRFNDIGLALIECPDPLHYYALFSCVDKCDIVVTLYDGNRYEIEQRYSTYVEMSSRPVLPRVSMQKLAEFLNHLEQVSGSPNVKRLSWISDFIDSPGPLLRIEDKEMLLSKAEKYGHPFERPIHKSAIPPSVFTLAVTSYFRFALSKTNKPEKRKTWNWKDIQNFNDKIDWSEFHPVNTNSRKKQLELD